MTPRDIQDLFAEALRHHQEGRTAEAERQYARIIAAEPMHADSHHLLGVIALQAGQYALAAERIAHAIAIDARNPAFHSNLSYAFAHAGRAAEAVEAARQALALSPLYPEALNNLGVALQDLKRREEAAAAYRRAVELHAGYAEAHNNLGNVLQELGRADEAVAAFRRAVDANPNYAEAYNSLGTVLHVQGRIDDAIAAYRRTIDLNPDYAEAHFNLGDAFFRRGQFPEAVGYLERAVALKPAFAKAHSALLYAHSFHHALPQEEILAAARRFERLACPPLPPAAPRAITGTPKLKVGVISTEIGHHAESCFLESYLRHYDRGRISLTLYQLAANASAKSRDLIALADQARDLSGLGDTAARARILADGIDVLIDINSHLGGNRLPMLSQRCAPIQAHYIGYPGTTGVNAIDYFIGDAEITPPSFQPGFSETLIRLPRLWVAYHPPAAAPQPSAPNTPQITFGNFNTLAKASAPALALWGDVLNAVPGSRLILKDNADKVICARVQDALEARGVDRTRLAFLPWVPDWNAHMALYNLIDIALDSFPLNSGTTGFDALFMGTPLVAMRGDWMGGRMSSAMLTALGHPEWIAETPEGYVEIVRGLAADLPRLRAFKRNLRAEMLGSPLCDGKSLAAALEDAFSRMVAAHNARTGLA